MKKRKTAKFRVALGQVGLLVSLLLFALMLGLVPDRSGAIREGRAALAESITINVTRQVMQSSIPAMESDLQLIVDRNKDLLSAAIRRGNHNYVVVVGDHTDHWRSMSGELSCNSQVLVPIYSGKRKWGQLELRFVSTAGMFGLSSSQSQVIPMIAFLSLTGFLVFYLYLGKMLRHLDPSKAIPQRVQSALDTMAEGLLVIDIKGQLVLANSAFAEIVGMPVHELLGRKVHDFGWSIDSALHKDLPPWTLCLETGEQQRNSVVHLKDQHDLDRTFIVNCSPVIATGGKHGGALISFDDVTQLEEKKKQLGEAKEAAEAANQSKSEFLANMSHEIRTPMNAILGFTDILRRGYGKSQQDPREYLNTIHSSATHLLELINDILDLSKVEAGRLDLERIVCSPHIVVKDVLQVLAVKATEKGITLDFEVDGPIPETILTDPSRLRQIITNLVGNAIKFTTTGGVNVVLHLEQAAEQKFRIDIRDSGIGMSQEQMDRIFDPFSQADSSVTRRFGGTGLGLAISRQFAEALGGGISVQSEPGVGSVFSVIVDTGDLSGIKQLQPHELDYDQKASVSNTQWKFSSQRVLVVDDGKENRDLVAVVLQEVGLNVEGAENGQVGVDIALKHPFDLILMDMQMPVMDGYDATRLLREKGITTPIYALTANAMQGFEKKCLAAGCTGFMTKPIDIDVLLDTLGELLGGTKIDTSQNFTSTISTPVVQPTETQELLPLVSSLPLNVPTFASVVRTFVTRLDEQLETMIAALRSDDFERLAQLAHWLKGSGGTCGFGEFTEPSKHLEECAKQGMRDGAELALQEIALLARRIEMPAIVESELASVLPCNREFATLAAPETIYY